MDNFNLRKFLSEGKLHEAMSAQDTEDIAGMVADEFTKESADEGEYLRYSVGRVEGTGFELDTEATDMSSEDLDMRGVGEGWGGNFRVEASEDGIEVRNAEKGGLVATIDSMGNFRMLSADESRAEMGRDTDYMEEGFMDKVEDFLSTAGQGVDNPTRPGLGEETKSNKMKKSELKEMIKAAMLAEAEDEDVEEGVRYNDATRSYEKTDDEEGLFGLDPKRRKSSLREKDEEVADDIELEDEADVDVDVDVDMDAGEGGIDVKQDADSDLSGTVGDVQDNLEAALEAARKLGDEKLEDQIGNTLTFFTRSHVVK